MVGVTLNEESVYLRNWMRVGGGGEPKHPNDSAWTLDQSLSIIGVNNFILPLFLFKSQFTLHFVIYFYLSPPFRNNLFYPILL